MTAIIKLPRLKRTALFIIAMFVFLIGMIVASVVVSADTFHTVRVNYYFLNGQPAHDPYIATYKMLNDPVSVDLTITNPNINGFIPMVLNDGFTNPSTDLPSHGVKKEKITYSNSNFTERILCRGAQPLQREILSTGYLRRPLYSGQSSNRRE